MCMLILWSCDFVYLNGLHCTESMCIEEFFDNIVSMLLDKCVGLHKVITVVLFAYSSTIISKVPALICKVVVSKEGDKNINRLFVS